jgi:hypothetical protein
VTPSRALAVGAFQEQTMPTRRIDIAAPIVPGRSLGGIKLRTRSTTIEDLMMEEVVAGAEYGMAGPFEVRYLLGPNGEVGLSIDVRKGRVFKMIAFAGHQGRLFKNIAVGMPVRDAFSQDPRLYYDEVEGAIRCEGVNGLVIDVPRNLPSPAAVPDQRIEAISVHVPQLDTQADW